MRMCQRHSKNRKQRGWIHAIMDVKLWMGNPKFVEWSESHFRSPTRYSLTQTRLERENSPSDRLSLLCIKKSCSEIADSEIIHPSILPSSLHFLFFIQFYSGWSPHKMHDALTKREGGGSGENLSSTSTTARLLLHRDVGWEPFSLYSSQFPSDLCSRNLSPQFVRNVLFTKLSLCLKCVFFKLLVFLKQIVVTLKSLSIFPPIANWLHGKGVKDGELGRRLTCHLLLPSFFFLKSFPSLTHFQVSIMPSLSLQLHTEFDGIIWKWRKRGGTKPVCARTEHFLLTLLACPGVSEWWSRTATGLSSIKWNEAPPFQSFMSPIHLIHSIQMCSWYCCCWIESVDGR